MSIEEFIEAAKVQDSRNVFEKGDEVEFAPEELKEFYKKCDPVDVEVNIAGAIIRFVPIVDLQYMQEDYSLGEDSFVFATCDGDPIFIKEGAVYTNAHGTLGIDDEKLSDSLEKYLGNI